MMAEECRRLTVPNDIWRELEAQTLLVHTGGVHLSGSIHADIKKSYALPDSPVIRSFDNLKAAALDMAAALEAGDMAGYIDALNRSRTNHYAMHESCNSDVLRCTPCSIRNW